MRLARRMTDANFRFNTMAEEGCTAEYILRWECTCAGCLGQVHKGERAQYVDDLICHIGCRPAPRFRVETKTEPPLSFTQFGKREPPLCLQCFTFHVGECL